MSVIEHLLEIYHNGYQIKIDRKANAVSIETRIFLTN